MKKLLSLLFIVACFSAKSQTYQQVAGRGFIWKGGAFDTSLHIPSSNGVPVLNDIYNKKSAISVDTTNKVLYFYDAKTMAWWPAGTGAGGGVDSSFTTLQIAFNNDSTAFTKINAHNQTLNIDSAKSMALIARSKTLTGGYSGATFVPGSYSLQQNTPGTYGSSIISNDSVITLRSILNTFNGRFKLSPSTATISRANGSYKNIGTSINGELFDESGNITIDFTSNPPNPNDPITDTVEGVARFYIAPDLDDSGRLKRFYTAQLPRGIDTAYATTDTTLHFLKIVDGVADEWDVLFAKSPVVVDGVTITGTGVTGDPLVASGSGSVTTADSTLTASAAQTAFTYTSVPATYSDYWIARNGVLLHPITDYTTSGNVVTTSFSADSGDKIRYHRTK